MWNVMLHNWMLTKLCPFETYDYHGVDHFQGSKEHDKNQDYYCQTLLNLTILREDTRLKIIKNDSVSQSKNYQDHSLDFVYIDAGHDYESVKADIQAWLPKIKPNGIIAGDDYNPWWGVPRAVNEMFPNKVKTINPTSRAVQWLVLLSSSS